MAERRTKSTSRRRSASRRRRARGAVAEQWVLLLLGMAAFIVAMMGVIDSWPFATPLPNNAKRMTMAEARASNAAVPIAWRRQGRPARYRFHGGSTARAQAVDCLATAALYEAGDDARGQKAVMQVVLNRVRSPGFPGTICGVVYQGSTRKSGCQFSFTCDGSFQRRRVRLGWAAARQAARRALAGYVFPDVGRATHYHTDWIVPYWRDSLVKVARVGPHLFYVRR